MLFDALIVVALVVGMLVGFFRGALRQFVVLGAWFVALVLAAQLRPSIADWLLDQEPDFTAQYAQMVAMVVAFAILFLAALLVIEVGGRTVVLGTRPIVDEALGGLTALAVGLLVIAALFIALGGYYAVDAPRPSAEIPVLRDLNSALNQSVIGRTVREVLVPAIQTMLGPLLPADVNAVR